jgi:Protein of unknown function (DUF3048) N-terminal domain/Protein of unknown function (DUF3048) C-terminal domain
MSTGGSNGTATKVSRLTAVLTVGVLAAALGACSSDRPKVVRTTSPAPAPVNPLTGLAPAPAGPVIVVKVDDTGPGRPSMGLEKSDVIYIEEAEGGESRMAAVFASAKPTVRAVRSVRASDPELVGPYGRIILVASGGGGSALPTLDRSVLHSAINDRGQVGFSRDPSRPAPYNLVTDLAKVSAAIKAQGVRDVGFTWAALDPRLASAAAAPTVGTLVGSTKVSFVWDPKLARYVRTVDGRRILAASGAPIAKPNVLVQYCTITGDRSDIDVLGNPSMYTRTIGTGRVVLFRNGKRIAGTWSRPSYGARTTFTDAAGKPLLFAPGGTFVALVRPGAPA